MFGSLVNVTAEELADMGSPLRPLPHGSVVTGHTSCAISSWLTVGLKEATISSHQMLVP